jgi:MinD superfamily P-loop ATPase
VKELVVISGKGGTGKTSVTAALATLATDKLLADCDVDAANLHLVLEPQIKREELFSGGSGAQINADACSNCGRCLELCRFEAIEAPTAASGGTYRVDPMACEGCGVCARFCPEQAITCEPVNNGRWFISQTRHGLMVHARLNAGGENSGKLVTLIRQRARQLAMEQGLSLLIVDGSPGVGCPVIASLSGSDLALIVSEPTVAGRHDFLRVAELAAHFHVPALLCVNKWDLNAELADTLEQAARERGIVPVGRIRYSAEFTRAQRRALSILESGAGDVAEDLRALWENVQPRVREVAPAEHSLKLL